MNYIQQILAFYDRQMINPLSSGQIALWHALMHVNNKCNWIEWFSVANQTLESLSGLSRQGVLKARNVLKQEGLIEFKSNGTKATNYRIKTLTTSNSVQVGIQDSVQVGIQNSVQSSIQSGVQSSSTLNKQNKTKQNKTKYNISLLQDNNINNISERDEQTRALQQLYEFYQNNFGIASGVITQSFEYWLNDMPLELILEAMTIAVKQQKPFRYAEAILKDWQQKNIKTIDDVQAEQVAFSNHQARKYSVTNKRVELTRQERDAMNGTNTPLSEQEKAKLLEGLS